MVRWSVIAVVVFGTFLCANKSVSAQEAATLYSAQGTVERRMVGATVWQAVAVGEKLTADESVRTGPASRAALVLADGLMVRRNQNSILQVKLDSANVPSEVTVAGGDAHFFSRKEVEFPRIKTELVSASIRGTEFIVSAQPGRSEIAVLAGLVRAENGFGGVDLAGGEQASVVPGGAPQKAILVNPTDKVQWALYYPVALDFLDVPELMTGLSAEETRAVQCLHQGDSACALGVFQGDSTAHRLGRALALYQRGDDAGALKTLGTDTSSPTFDLVRAALLLRRGQVADVGALHQRIETTLRGRTDPSATIIRGALLAQRAIIAITQNDVEAARGYVSESIRLSGGTPNGAIALSYVEQAQGQVDTALEEIERALAQHPESSALLLRRAELHLSRGESKAALADSTVLTERMPSNGYGFTVRGFAELARLDVEGARVSFEKAIELGSGDGLPFLGRGLTQIRRGDLTGGRLSIQQAAHLEPARALYRSYLGKALFEEERENLSGEEYDRAIALDPNDPTPYLYRTFLHLSKNDPVKALEDIETSIKLNDNRSVYRSRLLLDQDASVRSSSLAEVYKSLGFTDLSRVEALRAITQDYANYTAHLDLSQSYESSAELLQSSISEFFIARLLSPVSFNLVRPSQASGISANDYSAVFDRDQTRTSVEVDGRTKDRFVSPGFLVSGTEGRWGWALSHSPSYADGYRDNDRTNDLLTYGSLQYQLSPETSLLLDSLMETFDNGDTEIGFDPYAVDADEVTSFDDYLVRLGANHRFGPGSQVISQVVASHSNLRAEDPTFNRLLYVYLTAGEDLIDALTTQQFVDQRFRFKSNNLRGDVQHIFTHPLVSNVFGGGLFNGSQDKDDEAVIPIPADTGTALESSAENTESSRRLYNYFTLHAAPWLDLQAGVSYTHLHLGGAPLSVPFSEDTTTKEFVSPKFGAILTPTDSTTFRAAYFETTSSAGIREVEIIEPTVVSGFNQTFFELFPGTSARSIAFGLDQKFDSKTYVGAELIRRSVTRNFPLTVSQLFFDIFGDGQPTFDIFTQENEAHIDDHQFRTYLYQILGSRISLTSDYLRGVNEDNLFNSETNTERVRLGINYFDPSGWFGFSRASWRNQSSESNTDPVEGAESSVVGDSFWLVDVGVGYRFPKRHGRVVLSVNNIFDTDYQYFAPAFESAFVPGVNAFVSFSYNF